jgi:hypothetical protein
MAMGRARYMEAMETTIVVVPPKQSVFRASAEIGKAADPGFGMAAFVSRC